MAPIQPAARQPEDMSSGTGHFITAISFGFPMVALAFLGLVLGNGYTAAAFATIWSGVFLAASLRFVRKTTFLVVERFGYFWDIKFAGPRVLIPWIDAVVLREDFLQKEVKLFEGIQIDFRDGSAPVRTSAWYQIGDPEQIAGGNLGNVRKQILLYTYRVRAQDRKARVADIFQSSFRPLLEAKTVVEAQAQAEELAKYAIDGAPDRPGTPKHIGARVALEEIGVYPFPGKGIVIPDIDLPQELIRLREQKLRGEADAQEAVNRSRGYWEPLKAMKEGLAAANVNLPDDTLREFFITQRGLETVAGTKSNITFVSPDLKGVLAMVGATGQKGANP